MSAIYDVHYDHNNVGKLRVKLHVHVNNVTSKYLKFNILWSVALLQRSIFSFQGGCSNEPAKPFPHSENDGMS